MCERSGKWQFDCLHDSSTNQCLYVCFVCSVFVINVWEMTLAMYESESTNSTYVRLRRMLQNDMPYKYVHKKKVKNGDEEWQQRMCECTVSDNVRVWESVVWKKTTMENIGGWWRRCQRKKWMEAAIIEKKRLKRQPKWWRDRQQQWWSDRRQTPAKNSQQRRTNELDAQTRTRKTQPDNNEITNGRTTGSPERHGRTDRMAEWQVGQQTVMYGQWLRQKCLRKRLGRNWNLIRSIKKRGSRWNWCWKNSKQHTNTK